MGEVLAIISRKGGGGKTTTAQALADGIRRAGHKVLLIDLDSQANLTNAMGADPGGMNATDLFDGVKPARLIQHTNNGDIIAGCGDLAAADVILTDNTQLKKCLRPFQSEYDYILIDTPASYGRLTMNALNAANSAIITIEPATFGAAGLEDLAAIVKQIRRTNKNLILRGIILTRCDTRSNEVKTTIANIEAAAAGLKTQLIRPFIRSTIKVQEAQHRQQNLIDYAPKSTAAVDYMEVVKVLLNK